MRKWRDKGNEKRERQRKDASIDPAHAAIFGKIQLNVVVSSVCDQTYGRTCSQIEQWLWLSRIPSVGKFPSVASFSCGLSRKPPSCSEWPRETPAPLRHGYNHLQNIKGTIFLADVLREFAAHL